MRWVDYLTLQYFYFYFLTLETVIVFLSSAFPALPRCQGDSTRPHPQSGHRVSAALYFSRHRLGYLTCNHRAKESDPR